jgi:phospholipid/cholesterol/gamma-HCH transport system substrate-binding protein
MRRRVRFGVSALCVSAVVASGCGYKDVYSLPLPGGVGGGPGSYKVIADFADAGNLVPDESCRANDVPIGTITSITVTPDLRAQVVCKIEGSAHLPANTDATIETTSLLGEAYVALGPPSGEAPQGRIAAGATIPDSGTHDDPDVEEILGSLSAILNDGDIGDLQTITTELNNALSGHESDVRALLTELNAFTGRLNRHRGDITAALDGLNRLGATLAAQRRTLGAALDAIPGGLKVLNDQRPELIDALHRLASLSQIGTRVIHASQANTVADLKALSPTLAGLGKDGKEIAAALELVPDFPFPRNSLASVKGDYSGFYATVNLSLDTINTLLKQEGVSVAATKQTRHAPKPTGVAKPPAAGALTKVLDGLLGITPKPLKLPPSVRKLLQGLDSTVNASPS